MSGSDGIRWLILEISPRLRFRRKRKAIYGKIQNFVLKNKRMREIGFHLSSKLLVQ